MNISWASRAALALSWMAAGCGANTTSDSAVLVKMDFTRAAFYDAPFPSDDLRKGDNTIDLSRFPNPNGVEIIKQALSLITRDARGFAVSGAVYFQMTGAIDPMRLPDLKQSTSPDASVFLMDIERKARQPAVVSFAADGGPFGAPNLLSVLPMQGIPMRPGKTYAAVIRRGTLDDKGHPLAISPQMAALASGEKPAGISDRAFKEYRDALATLANTNIPASDISGLAVFTTDDPEAAMSLFRQSILAIRPAPATSAFTKTDEFPDYCVYGATLSIPDYQHGTAPYQKSGGDWLVDVDGKPQAPHDEKARIVVTIPRAQVPAAGFPTVVLVRTGAGGDRPLVDRGVQKTHDGPSITAGSGPAQEFARVGFAGVQIDGPLGGLRNTTGGDEQFLVFNVFNASALRDNVRESALELVLLAHLIPDFHIDTSDCPGASPMSGLDQKHLALMGHSMGATIAPLAAAAEPRYRALILSGAGGSYIENVMWKRKPLYVRPIAEALFNYDMDQRDLTESDPALTMVQWAAEPSDPQVYAHRIIREPDAGTPPRHVLMEQGIVDNYILPRIANSLSLPLGLDLGGAPLDTHVPQYEMQMQTPILDVLPLVGRASVSLPASGNLTVNGLKVTGLVVQHAEDGIEDGHEVVFQTEAPKHQYRCFLLAFAKDLTPVVPMDGAADAPCP